MKKPTFLIVVFVLLSHNVSFSQSPNRIEIDAGGVYKFTPEKGELDLNKINTLLVLRIFDSAKDFGVQFKNGGNTPLNKTFLTGKRKDNGDIIIEIKKEGNLDINGSKKKIEMPFDLVVKYDGREIVNEKAIGKTESQSKPEPGGESPVNFL